MIVIKDADGTIRYPFGEFETADEKVARLEKELRERDEQIELIEGALSEIAKMMFE